MSILPDRQKTYMDALDNAFDMFIVSNSQISNEDANYLIEEYSKIDRNALAFTAEEFEETYEPSTDSFSAFDALEHDMEERIQAKKRFLREIEEDYGDVGDGCAYNIRHVLETRQGLEPAARYGI